MMHCSEIISQDKSLIIARILLFILFLRTDFPIFLLTTMARPTSVYEEFLSTTIEHIGVGGRMQNLLPKRLIKRKSPWDDMDRTATRYAQSFFLPFFLLFERTRRPPTELILAKKPCRRLLTRLLG